MAIHNTEKQIQENKAKLPQNVVDQVTADITALNEALTTDDVDKIREALERLRNSGMEIGKAIYSQQSSEDHTAQPEQEEKKEEEPKKEEEKK